MHTPDHPRLPLMPKLFERETMNPRLRFPKSELSFFATRYQYPIQETMVISLAETISRRGWMTKDDLRIVARWKAPRSAGHVEGNSEEYVKEITAFALAATNERCRIEILTNLDGVRWPTASVILHFFHTLWPLISLDSGAWCIMLSHV